MERYLIVGLGNIGLKYRKTRHNVGFEIVSYLAKKQEVKFIELVLKLFLVYIFDKWITGWILEDLWKCCLVLILLKYTKML